MSHPPTPEPNVSPDEARHYARNITKYQLFYVFHDLQMWMPIWVLFLLTERGFSFSDVTLIGIPFWTIAAFGQVPAGVVADRIGRAWCMRLGPVLYAGAMIVLGLSGSMGEVLISWILWALAMTLVAGADSALLHDSLRAIGRSEEFEKYAGRTFAIRSSAMVAATLLGGPLAGATDIRVPILLGPVASLTAAAIAFSMHEPPRDEESILARGESYFRSLREAAKAAWRVPAVRYVIPLTAVLLAGAMPSEYLLQPFLISHNVELGFEFSALQVPVRLTAVLGAITAFWWAARFGNATVLIMLPILMVGAYAGLGLVDHLGALAFMMGIGFGRATAMPVVEGYINRRVPSSRRATILSLNHMSFSILVIPLLPALGFGVDDVGIRTVFGVAAATIGTLALIIGSFWIRAHRRDPVTLRQKGVLPSLEPAVVPTAAAVSPLVLPRRPVDETPAPEAGPAPGKETPAAGGD